MLSNSNVAYCCCWLFVTNKRPDLNHWYLNGRLVVILAKQDNRTLSSVRMSVDGCTSFNGLRISGQNKQATISQWTFYHRKACFSTRFLLGYFFSNSFFCFYYSLFTVHMIKVLHLFESKITNYKKVWKSFINVIFHFWLRM